MPAHDVEIVLLQPPSLLVRAMLGVPGTQQCEAQYQDGRRCTETLIVTICASAGRVAGPTAFFRGRSSAVELHPSKVNVVGSNPTARSSFRAVSSIG